jgi:hypothetical protein
VVVCCLLLCRVCCECVVSVLPLALARSISKHMARSSVVVLLVVAIAVALMSSTSVTAFRVGTYFLGTGPDVSLLNSASAASTQSAMLNYISWFQTSKPDVRMMALAEQIVAQQPAAFGFQDGVSIYTQSPPTAFPASTPLTGTYDTVKQLFDSLQSRGVGYTVINEALDLDVTVTTGQVPDPFTKYRVQIRSGLAVRNDLVANVVPAATSKAMFSTANQNVFVGNSAITAAMYGAGYQRIKIFVDSAAWTVSHTSIVPDSLSTNALARAQIREVLDAATNDQFSIVLGYLGTDANALVANAYSVAVNRGYLDPAELFSDTTKTSLQTLQSIAYTTTMYVDHAIAQAAVWCTLDIITRSFVRSFVRLAQHTTKSMQTFYPIIIC